MTKADFDSIYTAADPRRYYAELGPLDYQIPEHGGRIFSQLAVHLAQRRSLDAVHVVDLCCSYGVNATVMKFGRSLVDVIDHYTDERYAGLSAHEMLQVDRAWFGTPKSEVPLDVLGIDISEPAVDYALRAGLIDDGIAENLEDDAASPRLVEALGGVDLVTVTGGIGYITERTVGRVLDLTPASAWFAALSLRWIDFAPIAHAAAGRGLVTERLDGITFRQRRFADQSERDFACSEIERLGLEPPPADGYHHADLYVMRPPTDADPPLPELVG